MKNGRGDRPIIVKVDLQRGAAAIDPLVIEVFLFQAVVGDGEVGDVIMMPILFPSVDSFRSSMTPLSDKSVIS